MSGESFVTFRKGERDMLMDDMKFSDKKWIDLPCYMIFFILMVIALFTMMYAAEDSLFKFMKNSYPFWRDWVAPLIEEATKFLSLTFGISFGIAFTIIFAFAEMWKFVHWSIMTENYSTVFLIMRSIAVGVHLTTLSFQVFSFKMYYKYKRPWFLGFGFVSAVILHYTWNVSFGKFVFINVAELAQYLGL